MAEYNYEWWTVQITDTAGTVTWEFKGKNKNNVIRQIKKLVKETNSKENAQKPALFRKAPITAVHWETLKLDRVGYQRRF